MGRLHVGVARAAYQQQQHPARSDELVAIPEDCHARQRVFSNAAHGHRQHTIPTTDERPRHKRVAAMESAVKVAGTLVFLELLNVFIILPIMMAANVDKASTFVNDAVIGVLSAAADVYFLYIAWSLLKLFRSGRTRRNLTGAPAEVAVTQELQQV